MKVGNGGDHADFQVIRPFIDMAYLAWTDGGFRYFLGMDRFTDAYLLMAVLRHDVEKRLRLERLAESCGWRPLNEMGIPCTLALAL